MADPAAIGTMAGLRAEIDGIDAAILDLLARRDRCIARAIELKRIEGLPPRTEGRIAEVVAHVRRLAGERSLDPDLVERIWRELIEAAIAVEARHLDEPAPAPPRASQKSEG